MKWYKYLPEIHADSMIRNGCIKLGILSGYREIEKHGIAVGDPDENTRTIFSHDKGVKTSLDQLNPLERQFINFGEGVTVKDIHIENNSFHVHEQGEELLAYCVSKPFDLASMQKMSEENIAADNDAYDACVEISNHAGFIREVSTYLKNEHGFQCVGHGDCFYAGRMVHWSTAHASSAWSLKDASYAYQKESRIVLRPPEGFDQENLIVNIPEIKKYCRLYELPA